MSAFNVSATLNVFRLIARPTLCLPHATVSTFAQLPIPLNQAFGKYKNLEIRAVVLDKDNCFAYPHSNEVHKPYQVSYLFFNIANVACNCKLATSAFSSGLKINKQYFQCYT